MPTFLNNTPYLYVFLFLGMFGNSSYQEFAFTECFEIASDKNTESDLSAHLEIIGQGEILEQRVPLASCTTARILCQDDEDWETTAKFLELQKANAVSIDPLIVSAAYTSKSQVLLINLFRLYMHHNGNPPAIHNQLIPPSPRQGSLVAA